MGETLQSTTTLQSSSLHHYRTDLQAQCQLVQRYRVLSEQHTRSRKIVMDKINLLIQSSLLQDSVMPSCKMLLLDIIPPPHTHTHSVAHLIDG